MLKELGAVLDRAVAEERSRLAAWVNGTRALAVTGWLAAASVVANSGYPHWRQALPALATYAILGWLTLAAVLRWPWARLQARVLPPILDVPMVFWVMHAVISAQSSEGKVLYVNALALLLIATFLSQLYLAWRVVAATSALSIAAMASLAATLHLPWQEWLPLAFIALPVAALGAGYTVTRLRRLVERTASEQQARIRLGRYFSPTVASRIAELGAGTADGEHREVTILFADIRGFTAMSERMESPEVVAMLNEYLS